MTKAEKSAARVRKFRAGLSVAQKEKYLTYQRLHNSKRTSESIRKHSLARYNITSGGFDALLLKQHGCCAVCLTDEPGGKCKQWQIDHDHTTGIVRGLLCVRCNVGLGHFSDDVAMLKAAIAYLKKRKV
jgi:hypothetical protein